MLRQAKPVHLLVLEWTSSWFLGFVRVQHNKGKALQDAFDLKRYEQSGTRLICGTALAVNARTA